ncbi:hypothetical protein BC938DRAFT_477458 [Jimgerdemannia flammicorona]|uniref:Uncharacterized protein n=1 Tax=Jimgerdemannia flammicorona TaxID=994334 RepID=A0A433QP98_9FUNG|nr:hypothetical protein BC938DRAFT_477458 [Jimgerdemannia flammicorona]
MEPLPRLLGIFFVIIQNIDENIAPSTRNPPEDSQESKPGVKPTAVVNLTISSALYTVFQDSRTVIGRNNLYHR